MFLPTLTDSIRKEEEQSEKETCGNEGPELVPLKAKLILAMEQAKPSIFGRNSYVHSLFPSYFPNIHVASSCKLLGD